MPHPAKKTYQKKQAIESLRLAFPHLLPLLAVLALVAGILGLTLFQNTSDTSFDTRRDASIAGGSVKLISQVSPQEDSSNPDKPGQRSVTFLLDSNSQPIDAFAATFTIQNTAGGTINISTRGLSSRFRPIITQLEQDGQVYRGTVELITTNPQQPYVTIDTPLPVFELVVQPEQVGTVSVDFDHQRSVALTHAGVRHDILDHVETVSFSISAPATEVDDDFSFYAPERSIRFYQSGTDTLVDRTDLEVGTEYDLFTRFGVQNTKGQQTSRDVPPVVVKTSIDGKILYEELDYNATLSPQADRAAVATLRTSFIARSRNTIEQIIDPDNVYSETNESNNTYSYTFSAETEDTGTGTGGVSACSQPTDIELEEVSCGGEGLLYIGLDWKRPSGAKEFELQLSRERDFDKIYKRVYTTSSEWQPSSSIDDNQWYARVRVSESDESCQLPGAWSVVTFDIDCDDEEQEEIKLCNESCQSNNECPVNHACYNTGEGKRCRLAHNPTSSTCQALSNFSDNSRQCNQSCYESNDCANGRTCWYNTCREPTNLLSPICSVAGQASTSAQCNQACSSNADCDVNLRCYLGSCRLATNVASPICAPQSDDDASPTKGGLTANDNGEDQDQVGQPEEEDATASDSATTATPAATVKPTPPPATPAPPETPTAQEQTSPLVRWLKGLLGAGSVQLDDLTDAEESQNPLLAMILIGLGAAILIILLLVVIIRALTGRKPRGVITPSSGTGSNSSGSSSPSSSSAAKLSAARSSNAPIVQPSQPAKSQPTPQPVNAVVSRTKPSTSATAPTPKPNLEPTPAQPTPSATSASSASSNASKNDSNAPANLKTAAPTIAKATTNQSILATPPSKPTASSSSSKPTEIKVKPPASSTDKSAQPSTLATSSSNSKPTSSPSTIKSTSSSANTLEKLKQDAIRSVKDRAKKSSAQPTPIKPTSIGNVTKRDNGASTQSTPSSSKAPSSAATSQKPAQPPTTPPAKKKSSMLARVKQKGIKPPAKTQKS